MLTGSMVYYYREKSGLISSSSIQKQKRKNKIRCDLPSSRPSLGWIIAHTQAGYSERKLARACTPFKTGHIHYTYMPVTVGQSRHTNLSCVCTTWQRVKVRLKLILCLFPWGRPLSRCISILGQKQGSEGRGRVCISRAVDGGRHMWWESLVGDKSLWSMRTVEVNIQ